MKYFKYIDGDYPSFTLNKIYPENSRGEGSSEYPIVMYNAFSSENFQEVSEEEYLKQEGKMDKLISGEYYTVIESGNIFKYNKRHDSFYHIGNDKTTFTRGYGNFNSDMYAYRKATNEEIQWLEECNKQDKFIKFDEFKKQMDRKIIGYKLIKPEYKQAACTIEGHKHTGWSNIEGRIFTFEDHNEAISSWREAGVLDLWFEPIVEPEFKVGEWVVFEANRVKEQYPNLFTPVWNKDHILQIDEISHHTLRFKKQIRGIDCVSNNVKCFRKATPEEIKKAQIPDITINGYKAEFFNDYVKFGCAEFDKHEFIFAQKFIQKVLDSKNYGSSKTNREVESITFGKGVFTKEQIKQIVEYYKNK